MFCVLQCDPNLEVYSVWINTLDTRMPRIALFSRRDIEKGEELTFDYMASKPHSKYILQGGKFSVLFLNSGFCGSKC